MLYNNGIQKKIDYALAGDELWINSMLVNKYCDYTVDLCHAIVISKNFYIALFKTTK